MDHSVNECLLLGSGPSLLRLSEAERRRLNQIPVRIGLNKYAAFHRLAGIEPTHVFFMDCYDLAARRFLQHIFNQCIEETRSGLTFVLDHRMRKRLRIATAKQLERRQRWRRRIGLNDPPFALFLPVWRRTPMTYFVPDGCPFQFVSRGEALSGGEWARSLAEPLFHFRGSLSCVLNYISIQFPDSTIRLAGTDFNAGEYFFQAELETLGFDWRDWTTPLVRKAGLHFSVQSHQGATMFDRFPEIIQHLAASGNRLVCMNPDSLLVEKGFAAYEPPGSS